MIHTTEVLDMRCYDFQISLFEIDGTVMHTEPYTAVVSDENDTEMAREEADDLVCTKAEELMIAHDAHDYACTLIDVG
jgi:hypothetical protein